MASGDELRDRLRTLAGSDSSLLDSESRARLGRSVVEEGPRVLRRAKVRRLVLRAGGGAVLATAAALALAWVASEEEAVVEAPRVESSPESTASEGVGPVAGRRCETWSVTPAGWSEASMGRRRLDLDERVSVVLEPDAEVELVRNAPCETSLRLVRGRVVVQARDLGSGELAVRAGGSVVRVHGTLFSVTWLEEALGVEVTEGLVSVEREGGEVSTVAAGDVLSFAEGRVSIEPLAPASSAELVRVIEDASATGPAPTESVRGEEGGGAARVEGPSAEELAGRAARLQRSGDAEGARRLYRRAGAGAGAAAEAAWLSIARLELEEGRPAAALRALRQLRHRFPGRHFRVEAAWLEVRARRATGDNDGARRLAREIVEEHPDTPQAAAARRLIDEGGEGQ